MKWWQALVVIALQGVVWVMVFAAGGDYYKDNGIWKDYVHCTPRTEELAPYVGVAGTGRERR